MPRAALVVCLVGLAGSAGAQSRFAAPAEIKLAPSSFESAAPLSPPMTANAVSPLSPAALAAPSASFLPPPSVVPGAIPALALSPVVPAAATAGRPAAVKAATPAALTPVSAPSIGDRLRRVRSIISGATGWLKPAASEPDPSVQVPWTFKLKDGDFYYHGTTLDDLVRVVEAGGEMAPAVSQYSIRSADSIMYGADRRRKLALPDNPAVLLQFRYDDLKPLVSADAFKADVLAAAQMSYFSLHSAYAAAAKPVPLSLMTAESKESLLAYLRAREAERPGEPKWAELRAKFERALGVAP